MLAFSFWKNNSASSYPLDGQPVPLIAYSLNRKLMAYGGDAFKIRRADSATRDVPFSGTEVDNADYSIWAGIDTLTINEIYDQTTNYPALAVSVPSEPELVRNGINATKNIGVSLPSIFSIDDLTIGTEYEFIGVVKHTSLGQMFFWADGIGSGDYPFYAHTDGLTIYHYANPGLAVMTPVAYPLNVFQVLRVKRVGTAVSVYINGAILISGILSSNDDLRINRFLGATSMYTNGLSFCEAIAFTEELSDPASLEADIMAYYGI